MGSVIPAQNHEIQVHRNEGKWLNLKWLKLKWLF
jgi:hypothetical protein